MKSKKDICCAGNEYLVNERPKDFLKGKKSQNALYIRNELGLYM